MAASIEKIGGWDERGMISNMFDRSGFNYQNGILELAANSIDAKAENITYMTNDMESEIFIIDDGDGMDYEGLRKMAIMSNENRFGEKKIGTSGVGAKTSFKKLSKSKWTNVYSHPREGDYLKVNYPWERIGKIQKYEGEVSITTMNKDEIIMFHKYCPTGKGTIIQFPHSDEVWDHIQTFRTCNDVDPMVLPNVINGYANVAFHIVQKGETKFTLPMYSPLTLKEGETDYDGIPIKEIEFKLYQKGKDIRYIEVRQEEGKSVGYEVRRRGSKWSKEGPQKCIDIDIENTSMPSNGWKLIEDSEIILKMYLPKDDTRNLDNLGTDGANPRFRECFSSGESNIASTRSFRNKTKFYRNGSMIGCISPDGMVSLNSYRASPANVTIGRTEVELHLWTNSNQVNDVDIDFGIEFNKNQFDEKNISKGLQRHITYLREEYGKRAHIILERLLHGSLEETETIRSDDEVSHPDETETIQSDDAVSHPEETEPIQSDDTVSHPEETEPIQSDDEVRHPEETVISLQISRILNEFQANLPEQIPEYGHQYAINALLKQICEYFKMIPEYGHQYAINALLKQIESTP